jgi:hypothetical protein
LCRLAEEFLAVAGAEEGLAGLMLSHLLSIATRRSRTASSPAWPSPAWTQAPSASSNSRPAPARVEALVVIWPAVSTVFRRG